MAKMKVRVKKAKNGEVFWRLSASNGQTIATCAETYGTASHTRKIFTRIATNIRTMTDEQFCQLLEGLREPITE